MAATSVSAIGFKAGVGLYSSLNGSWETSLAGEDYTMLVKSVSTKVPIRKPAQLQPMMKNVNEGKGNFAPAVVLMRNIVGKKRFNKLRGKAIALQSQGQMQNYDRLAKKNGQRLGYLALFQLMREYI